METDQRYAELLDTAPLGIARIALNGRFQRVNPQLCAESGYSEKELLSMSLQDLLDPGDRDRVRVLNAQLVGGTSGPYSLEVHGEVKGGAAATFGLAGSLVDSPNGAPLYLVVVLERLT